MNREAFEAWFISEMPMESLITDQDNDYKYQPAIASWEAWQAALASQAQQSQWISVDERLPEDNSTVMAADQWGNIQITFYTENHDYFNHTYGYKLNRKDHGKYSKRFEWARKYPTRITHWMPLPPAPEGE